MIFCTAFVVLPFVLGAAAQSSSLTSSTVNATSSTATSSAPIAIPSLDSCDLQCLAQSENSTTCQSYADFLCTCTNTEFQGAVESCLTSSCPERLSIARQHLENRCSALNITLATPLPAA